MCKPGDIVKYKYPTLSLRKWSEHYGLKTKWIAGKIYIDDYGHHTITYLDENIKLLYLGKENKNDKSSRNGYYVYKFLVCSAGGSEIFFFADSKENAVQEHFIKAEEE